MQNPKKFRRLITFGVILIGGVVATLIVVTFGAEAFKPRILAQAQTKSGIPLCVTQEKGEPFKTRFYFSTNGTTWGVFSIDHESFYWRRAEIKVDDTSKMATVLHRGNLVGIFNWEQETFYIASLRRTAKGAFWMPVGWKPGMRSDGI